MSSAWYRAGTVSVTNGSATVTGTGTNWVSSGVKPVRGDIFSLDGDKFYEILAIVSDTQLTLASNFAGTSGAGKAYFIIQSASASDITRFTAAITVAMNQKQLMLDDLDNWSNSTAEDAVIHDSLGAPRTVKTITWLLDQVEASAQTATDIATQIGDLNTAIITTEGYRDDAQQAVTDAQAQVAIAAGHATAAAGHATTAAGHAGAADTARIAAEQAETDAGTILVTIQGIETTISVSADEVEADRLLALQYRNEAEVFRDEAELAVASVTSGYFPAGGWDASGGSAPPTPSTGAPMYKITVAGTIAGIPYAVNDNIVWDGTSAWFKIDNTESFTSINGYTSGAINLTASDVGALAVGGTAANATKLATARTISLGGDLSGSAAFDGSGNITITATVQDDSHAHIIANVDGLQAALDAKQASLGYVPVRQGTGAGQGSNTVHVGWSAGGLLLQVDSTDHGNTWPIGITKNAATATKLLTARTIELAGDVTGSASFDGSGNITITAAVQDGSHSHSSQYLGLSAQAADSALLAGYAQTTVDNPNTIVRRDSNSDIHARLLRTSYAVQTSAPASSAELVFRNSVTDNYHRTMSGSAFASWAANHLSYVPTSRTVNGKALSSNITLTATDITSGVFNDNRIPAANNSATAGTGFGGFRYQLSGTTLNLYTT